MDKYTPLETESELMQFVENLTDGKYTYQPSFYPEHALSVNRGGVCPEIELSLPDLVVKIMRSATPIGFAVATKTIVGTLEAYLFRAYWISK